MRASNLIFSSDFQIRYNDGLPDVWRNSTPGRVKRVFFLLHSVQAGSEAHIASNGINIGGCFPGDKADGACDQ
jgi:hypothetical protein